jgi:hypothetical protein
MSAVPTDIALVAEPGSGRDEALPRNARIYFALIAIATAAATLPFMARLQDTHDWLAFFILGSAAAVAQLFVVRTPRDQAYHTAIVFLIAAAFMVPGRAHPQVAGDSGPNTPCRRCGPRLLRRLRRDQPHGARAHAALRAQAHAA